MTKMNRRAILGLLGAGAVAGGAAIVFGGKKKNKPFSSDEEKQLNFYNWDTYIGEQTIPTFTEATGVEVNVDLFADNDELFNKLRSGNPGYDIIVPSSDFVQRMIEADMLEPLDHDKIPNIDNLFKVMMDEPFDPGRKYSLPYQTGAIGLAYRKSAVGGNAMDTWKWLFDSPQFAGKISLLSEAGTNISHAAKYLGYSINTTNKSELDKAVNLILAQKKNIRAFAPDTGQDLLLARDVDACMEWSGDIWQANQEDNDITFAFPKEGGLWFQDCLAIPKGAPHPENAHAFINHILDAEVSKEITEVIGYSTPNQAALALMPDDYKTNPILWPTDAVRKKYEASLYLGEDYFNYIEEAWTRIQAA